MTSIVITLEDVILVVALVSTLLFLGS